MKTLHQERMPLILLVDDVPANLHVLAAALRGNYRIKTATNGMDALELANREDQPQLILLDVMMPEMSGIEVLRCLREKEATRDIPVIFVTADVSEQSQLDGLDLGADDYLSKPIVTALLRARVRNVVARKHNETQLRIAAHVFEHSGEAIMITDHLNCIININPAFTRLTGYTLDELQGENPSILSSGRTSLETYQAMWQSINETNLWQGELWDRTKSGRVLPVMSTISVVRKPDGMNDFYITSYVDLSQQKANEEHIRHIAQHDALTGLPNRRYLQISLSQAIINARREKTELAVMFIDLDHFKFINDTLGHAIGDGLLIEVANRLRITIRESDLVARLGGDEFVVVLRLAEGQATEYAAQVAEKILLALSPPFRVDGHILQTTPSIGVALYPRDGGDMDTLMKYADVAMYLAKGNGRGRFEFFQTRQ